MEDSGFKLADYIDLAVRTESPWIHSEFEEIPEERPDAARVLEVVRHRHDKQIFRVLHGAIGMFTEIGEAFEALEGLKAGKWDPVNMAEELGDSAWYYGPICHELAISFVMLIEVARREVNENFDPAVQPAYALQTGLSEMSIGAGRILNECKRAIYYSSPDAKDKATGYPTLKIVNIDPEVVKTGLFIHARGLLRCASAVDTPIETICERNIAKLKKRYGEKFGSTAALTRDFEGERRVLEGEVAPVIHKPRSFQNFGNAERQES